MPKTSSLPGWRLYYLNGEMPKERLVEFTADKLPLCDKIWFDTRCVTSCRASQILNGLCKNMGEGEVELARAKKTDGSIWVSFDADRVLITDAAIPFPLQASSRKSYASQCQRENLPYSHFSGL